MRERPDRRLYVVATLWGFAEATLFFVIPDVLLSYVALSRLRPALKACGFATLGVRWTRVIRGVVIAQEEYPSGPQGAGDGRDERGEALREAVMQADEARSQIEACVRNDLGIDGSVVVQVDELPDLGDPPSLHEIRDSIGRRNI